MLGYDGFGTFGEPVLDASGKVYGTTIQGDGGYGNFRNRASTH